METQRKMRETLAFIERSELPVHGDPPAGAASRLRAAIELRERLIREQEEKHK